MTSQTSIFGKRELVICIRDAVKQGTSKFTEQSYIYMVPELHAPSPPLAAHALLVRAHVNVLLDCPLSIYSHKPFSKM